MPLAYVRIVEDLCAHVDSTIAANLPPLDDSALHADLAHVIGPLERGRDIADTCDVYDSDDDGEAEDEPGGSAQQPPAPRQRAAPAPARATPAASARKRKRGAVLAPATPARPAEARKHKAQTDSAISVQQRNPKQPGSASHRRYEKYKHARSRGEFSQLGGSAADFNHDSRKGFVVSGSPQRAT